MVLPLATTGAQHSLAEAPRGGAWGGQQHVLPCYPVAPRAQRGPSELQGFICLQLLTTFSSPAGGEEVIGALGRGC